MWFASGDSTDLRALFLTCFGRWKHSKHWDFVSFSEQMDTSTPAGKMIFTVLGAVAELERSLIVERIRAGLRNARVKGKKLGRPSIAVDAARIAQLRVQGLTVRQIAAELGHSRSLVHKTLANRVPIRAANAAD